MVKTNLPHFPVNKKKKRTRKAKLPVQGKQHTNKLEQEKHINESSFKR